MNPPFKKDQYPAIVNLPDILATLADPLSSQQAAQVLDIFDEQESIVVADVEEQHLINDLQEIWKAFFGIEEAEVYTDFFEFGGDSLKAMAMLKILQERYSVKIPIKVFFKKSAIADLAREIQDLAWVNDKKDYQNKITI